MTTAIAIATAIDYARRHRLADLSSSRTQVARLRPSPAQGQALATLDRRMARHQTHLNSLGGFFWDPDLGDVGDVVCFP